MMERQDVESARKLRPLRNQTGASFIISLLVVGIIASVAGVSLLARSNHLFYDRERKLVRNGIKIVAQKFKGVINNEDSWKKTTNFIKNTALQCYDTPGQSCCGLTGVRFTVIRNDNQPLVTLSTGLGNEPPTQAKVDFVRTNNLQTLGFTTSAEACSTFDDENGNAECPIRMFAELTAAPVIPGLDPECKFPPTIELIPEVKRGSRASDGLANIKKGNSSLFKFVRGSGPKTLARHCLKMNGVYDPTRNQCILRAAVAEENLNDTDCATVMGVKNNFTGEKCMTNKTCEDDGDDAGQGEKVWSFRGFDNEGRRICAAATVPGETNVCPAGEGIVSVSYSGGAMTRQCAPYPRMAYSDLSGCPPEYNQGTFGTWPSGGCPSWHQDPNDLKYCYCDVQTCLAAESAALPNAAATWRLWNGSTYECKVRTCDTGFRRPAVGQPDREYACYPPCTTYKGSGWDPGGGCKYDSCNSPFTLNSAAATCYCAAPKMEVPFGSNTTCKTSCTNISGVTAYNSSGTNVGTVTVTRSGYVEDGCSVACSNGWTYSGGPFGSACYQCALNACDDGCGNITYACTCPFPSCSLDGGGDGDGGF